MKGLAYIILVSLVTVLHAKKKEIDSIKTLLQAQDGAEKAMSLNELSWYYKNSDVDSSIYFAEQALAIGQEIESQESISSAYNNLGSAFSAKGSFDTALLFHQKAFQLITAMGDSLAMANSLNNQGIAYDELGIYDKSLDAYFQSLRIYEAVSTDPFDVAKVLGNIGIVYKKQKEYDKVLEY